MEIFKSIQKKNFKYIIYLIPPFILLLFWSPVQWSPGIKSFETSNLTMMISIMINNMLKHTCEFNLSIEILNLRGFAQLEQK